MMLFLFELKKLLICRRGLLIFALIAAETALAFLPRDTQHSYSPEIYRLYCEQLAGDYTPEKREEIFARLDEIKAVISQHEELEEEYRSGAVTLDAFSAHNKEYSKAQAELETVQYLADKCRYFDRLGTGRFFCDTDWEDFFTHRGYALTTVLLLLILIPPVFCNEYSTDMSDTLRTMRNGRTRLAVTKLTVCAAVMLAVSLLISAAELAAFAARFGTESCSEPLDSIMGFDGYGNISVLGSFLRSAVMRACSFAVCAVVICTLSVLTRSQLFTVFLGAAVCVTPAFITGNAAVCCILSPTVQNGMYPPGVNAALFCLLCTAKCAAYGAVCIHFFVRSK